MTEERKPRKLQQLVRTCGQCWAADVCSGREVGPRASSAGGHIAAARAPGSCSSWCGPAGSKYVSPAGTEREA